MKSAHYCLLLLVLPLALGQESAETAAGETPSPAEQPPAGAPEESPADGDSGGEAPQESQEPAQSAEENAEDAPAPQEPSKEPEAVPASSSEPLPVSTSDSSVLQSIQGYDTAKGQLAASLEVVNGNIETLRGEVNDYAQLTDDELDSALDMTTKATSILVTSQEIQLQQQLRETEADISELRARINQSTQVCQTFTLCDDCSRDSACVWCKAERKCVAGDRNGPLGGECLLYSYGACDGGCADHAQCAACLSDSRCGWCSNGSVCSEVGVLSCDSNFWLLKSTGGQCPGTVEATSSPYKTVNANLAVDTQLSRLQRELREKMDKAASLKEQIASMDAEMKNVLGGVNSADLGEIEDVDTTNTLIGLAAIVDYSSKQDQAEMLAKTREIAEEVGTQVSDATVAAVDTSNQARIQQEEKFMETIKSMTETMAEQNTAIESELSKQQEIGASINAQNAETEQDAAATDTAAKAAKDSSFLQEGYRSFLRP